MTRTFAIVTLLTIVGSLVLSEARYHGEDNIQHRHRHRHEVSTTRRNHEVSKPTRKTWNHYQEDEDYSDDIVPFESPEANEETEDAEDTEVNYYRPRNYPRSEPRYHVTRYHINSRHAPHPWQKSEELESRRRTQRFGSGRGHRTRPWTYPLRNHDSLVPENEEIHEEVEDYDDYDRSGWLYQPDEEDVRRRVYSVPRRGDYVHHRSRTDARRAWRTWKLESDFRRKSNHHLGARKRLPSGTIDGTGAANDGTEPDNWFRNQSKRLNSTGVVAEEDEDSIWNDAELDRDDDDDDDEDDSFDDDGDFDDDNDFFRDDDPPYKTFDDIIKSLTSEDPTTAKPPSVKRDYKSIETHLKRDAYGNLKYEPKNPTKLTIRRAARDPVVTSPRYSADSANQKFSNAIGGDDYRRSDHRRPFSKSVKHQMKTTLGPGNNNDDLNMADRDGNIQADITAEYADDESSTEDETSVPVTTPPITSTSTTTSTTTPRPVITTQAYDRRDSRLYDTNSSVQNNGLPSMHNAQKTQTNHHQPFRNGKSTEMKEAIQHAIKVSREGSCQWPRARVIPVREVYPSPSTTYIPHCAILHRCSDDTGCCRSEALTCVPKQSHKVELYFYTTTIGGASIVEKLSFYNHTECECREKTEYETTSDSKSLSAHETRGHRSFTTKQQHQSILPPQNIKRPPQKKLCKCPSEFTPSITIEGECQCNCFEHDQDCIRIRRGKGYFSLRDRMCIQNEECSVPICEFGGYIRRQGKCPRKKDIFDSIANYPNHMNHQSRFRS